MHRRLRRGTPRLVAAAVTAGVLIAGGASAAVGASSLVPAVDVGGRGQAFVLTVGGEPGSGASTLYRWTPGKGVRPVADIAAYQHTDPDPYNLGEDPPEESNPFGVAALPDGSALVADAAGNDLLRVYPD